MTLDTVFDLASLTKSVATSSSIMVLVQQGKLRLTDRVSSIVPAFTGGGKDEVTVEQLLLHTGGALAGQPSGRLRGRSVGGGGADLRA